MKNPMKSLFPVFVFALAAPLASFESKPGAHSFQVLVDDKLVIERYVGQDRVATTITLTSENKTLDVRYSECGRTVSGRSLTAKDAKDNVLKIWRFEGTTSGLKDAMLCKVSELRELALKNNNDVRMFYASNDFPQGWHVFTATAEGAATTASGN